MTDKELRIEKLRDALIDLIDGATPETFDAQRMDAILAELAELDPLPAGVHRSAEERLMAFKETYANFFTSHKGKNYQKQDGKELPTNMDDEQSRLYYTAILIEWIARKTRLQKSTLIKMIKAEGVQYIFQSTDALQTLSMEQYASKIINKYHIQTGTFPVEQTAGYTRTAIPIGKYYADLVIAIQDNPLLYPDTLYQIFSL